MQELSCQCFWRTTTPNREVICSSVLSMPSLLYQRDESGHVCFFWLSLILTRFWGSPSQWACSWKEGVELKNWSKVWKKLTKKGPEISGPTHLHPLGSTAVHACSMYLQQNNGSIIIHRIRCEGLESTTLRTPHSQSHVTIYSGPNFVLTKSGFCYCPNICKLLQKYYFKIRV